MATMSKKKDKPKRPLINVQNKNTEAAKRAAKKTVAGAVSGAGAGVVLKKGLAKPKMPGSRVLIPSGPKGAGRLRNRAAKERAEKEASRKRRATKKALANRNK